MKGYSDTYKRAASWMAASLPVALPFYLVRFSVGPLPMTLLEVHVVVMLVLTLMGWGVPGVKEAWKNIRPWALPVGLFLIASLAAVFWSPVQVAGLGLWRAYILEPIAVFFFLPILIHKPEQRKFLERGMVFMVIAMTLWAIAQYFGWLAIPSPFDVEGARSTGPFPYPNALALFIVPFGIYLFGQWLKEKKEWIYLIAAVSALISIVLAQSDGGLIAYAVGIFVVLMGQAKLRKPTIAIAVLGMITILAIPSLRTKFIEQVTFQGWSGRVRVWTWDETRHMLTDHPITGAGMAGYPIVFKPYHEKTFIEIFQYPHNIILNFWSETGLVGLIAFGWIVITAFRRRVSWYAMAPLIAILVHGLVDVPYFKNDLAIAFWVMVFLMTIPLDREAVKR